jgi:hypothetical protein
LSGLICDRSIMALAVAQQFHDRAWRSPAGDDRVTRSLNAGNVEDGHGLIGVRRAGRYGRCCQVCFSLSRCERDRTLISSARCRGQNRRRDGCGSGFNRRLAPYVRGAEDKYCTTCRNKRQRRHDYSTYQCGSHGYATVARPLARHHPGLILRRFVPVIKSA